MDLALDKRDFLCFRECSQERRIPLLTRGKARHVRDQAADDALRYLVLQCEHILARSIVVFCPQLVSGGSVDQVRGDSMACAL